jgi:transcriptional regulator with XRE-family HTH domain
VASGIGERLREARTARGLELPEIEKRTKIRARYLRALEEEQWDVLPADAYVRGFLRTYADYLGLDGAAMAQEYRSSHLLPPEEAGPVPRQIPAEQLRRRRLSPRGRRHPRAPLETRPTPEPPPPAAPRLPGEPWRPRPTPWTLLGIVAVVLLGGAFLLGLLGDSKDDGDGQAGGSEPATATDQTTTEETTTEELPSMVSVELTTTGTVWVCLVDAHDVPLIEGVTLTAGQKEGPFEARAFKIGLGNGAVDLTANDEPVRIPDLAEPAGYRITPEGTEELPEGNRPTCV